MAKKYKKGQRAIQYSADVLDSATAALSSAAVAMSLTGIGISVGAPLEGIAAAFGCASTGMTAANKKVENKAKKYENIHALAVAKHDSINSMPRKLI